MATSLTRLDLPPRPGQMPVIAGINRSSPLAAGLEAVWPGGGTHNLVSQESITSLGGMTRMPNTYSATADVHTGVNTGNTRCLSGWTTFTVVAWVKGPASPIGTYPRVISKNDNNPFFIYHNGTEYWRFAINAVDVSMGASARSDGTWQCLAVTFVSGLTNGRIGYCNGLPVVTGTQTATLTSNSNPIILGNREAGDRDLIGSLGPIAIWSRALTAEDIWTLYDPATRWNLYRRPARIVLPAHPWEIGAFEYVSGAQTASPGVGSVVVTGSAPVLTGTATIAVASGSLTFTGAAPSLVEVVGAQYARPISDVATGGWTPSTGLDLYAMLDETSADDDDYIYSSSEPSDDTAIVNLTELSTPTAGTVTMRIRGKVG